MNRYDEAIFHLDKALTIEPDNTDARIEIQRIKDAAEKEQYKQNDMEEVGSIVTMLGVAFCIGGIICAFIIQPAIHAASVVITITGMGFLAMFTGINIKSMSSNLFVELGFVLALIGVILFYIHYPIDWYYPLVSYVVLLYAAGILILIGNFCINTFNSQDL